MKQIRGITQEKLLKLIIPLDRVCCDDPEPLTQIFTTDSATVTFSGNGTEDDPLSAEAVGGGGTTPTLSDITAGESLLNNTVADNISFTGTSEFSLVGRTASFQNGAGVVGGTITGNATANTLTITGGSSGVNIPSLITIQGTANNVIMRAATGSVIGTAYQSSASTLLGRFGLNGNNMELVAFNAAGNINLTPGTAGSVVFPLTGLVAGTNTPIAATDTILQALAKLQAQISAL